MPGQQGSGSLLPRASQILPHRMQSSPSPITFNAKKYARHTHPAASRPQPPANATHPDHNTHTLSY
eukprot:scaffold16878_cov32-Cyclotella_meneghiniana.AAC.2